MAARNLHAAADAVQRHPERAAELGVDEAEVAAWRRAADTVVVPYDAELGVTSQSDGFTRYRKWDFETTRPEQYPLLLHFPYYLLYSSQVVKQADLVMALYLCGDRFDLDQKQRDFAFYEGITVRGSSLSACIQAIVAAEIGHLDLAYDYFRETALVDLLDVAGNTGHGVHLAALAGTWLVAVAGFGGMRDHGDSLAFAPRLPSALTRLRFRLIYRGRRLRIDVGSGKARYELLTGEPLTVRHFRQPIQLVMGEVQTHPCPKPPRPPPCAPPPGRAPGQYGVGADATTESMSVRGLNT